MSEPGLEELGSVVPSDRTIGNEHKVEHKFPPNIRKHFLTVSMAPGCSGRMWSLCSWRYLKATWTWSWTTGSRWSSLSRKLGPGDLQKSIPTATIL